MDLRPEYRFDTADERQLAEWRNRIWSVIIYLLEDSQCLSVFCRPSIEKANSYAPQHSRIFKEVKFFSLLRILAHFFKMVTFSTASKPFRYYSRISSGTCTKPI